MKKMLTYIRDSIDKSNMCSYTIEYSDKTKEKMGKESRLLSAEEHSEMSEIDFKEYFNYLSNSKKYTQWR